MGLQGARLGPERVPLKMIENLLGEGLAGDEGANLLLNRRATTMNRSPTKSLSTLLVKAGPTYEMPLLQSQKPPLVPAGVREHPLKSNRVPRNPEDALHLDRAERRQEQVRTMRRAQQHHLQANDDAREEVTAREIFIFEVL